MSHYKRPYRGADDPEFGFVDNNGYKNLNDTFLREFEAPKKIRIAPPLDDNYGHPDSKLVSFSGKNYSSRERKRKQERLDSKKSEMGKYGRKRFVKPELDYTQVINKERRHATGRRYTVEEMISCIIRVKKLSQAQIKRVTKLKIKKPTGKFKFEDKVNKVHKPSRPSYGRDREWDPVPKNKKYSKRPLPSRHVATSSSKVDSNRLKKTSDEPRLAYLNPEFAAMYGVTLPPNYFSAEPGQRIKLSNDIAKLPRIPKKPSATYIPVREGEPISNYEGNSSLDQCLSGKKDKGKASSPSLTLTESECSTSGLSVATTSYASRTATSASEPSLPSSTSSGTDSEHSWMNQVLSEDILNEVLEDDFCPDVTGLQKLIDESDKGKSRGRHIQEEVRPMRSNVSVNLEFEEYFNNDVLIIHAEDEPLRLP